MPLLQPLPRPLEDPYHRSQLLLVLPLVQSYLLKVALPLKLVPLPLLQRRPLEAV